MSLGDKIDNASQDLQGKAKEAAGSANGDESLRKEGKTDQSKASLKKAGEDLKDAVT